MSCVVGRWSGSERFSLDSDGLFSGTSQQRLSRVSADRDSALGADINDNRFVDGAKFVGSPSQFCEFESYLCYGDVEYI